MDLSDCPIRNQRAHFRIVQGGFINKIQVVQNRKIQEAPIKRDQGANIKKAQGAKQWECSWGHHIKAARIGPKPPR